MKIHWGGAILGLAIGVGTGVWHMARPDLWLTEIIVGVALFSVAILGFFLGGRGSED